MIRLQSGGRVDVLAHPQRLRRYGVPVGGPFDPSVTQVLESLLPGPGGLLILECSAAAAVFEAESPATVAFWTSAMGGRHQLNSGNTFRLELGAGMRGWIAVRQMDLASSVVSHLLSIGEGVRGVEIDLPSRRVDPEWLPKPPTEIRYIPNVERDFGRMTFQVDLRMDRKGIQLNGELGSHAVELPSAPTTSGSLQWTPGGSVLLLGPDGPTIGGYPPIGTVPMMELGKVAQLKPLTSVTFEPCSNEQTLVEEAHWRATWTERARWLSHF